MKDTTTSGGTRLRVGLVSVLAAVLVLGTVGPAHTQEAPTGTGTSTLLITPAALDITGLPVDLDASLGTLLADATNTGPPVARLALANVGAAGQTARELGISSADGDKSGSESRTVNAGGLGATVGLVDYVVAADAASANAALSALAAAITTPLGLGTDVGAQGLDVSADPTAATGAIAVEVTGLELGLGDLLPADVLDALPLSVLLDLVDSLGLPLSTDLLDQITDVDALLATLTEAVQQAEALAVIQSELDAAAIDLVEADVVAAAEAAVQSLEEEAAQLAEAIAALEAEIGLLETELLTLDSVLDVLRINEIESELTLLEAELAGLEDELEQIEATELPGARAVLTDAQEALEAALIELGFEDLLAELAMVEALLDDLLAQLDDLLAGLDLDALLADLLDALTGTPLLDLGSIQLVLGTLADGTSSAGTVTCTAGDLRVLGKAMPTPGCDAVGAALDGLAAAIGDALSLLPVAAPVPAVRTGGLEISSSGAGAPDADGITTAFARVSALTLDIAPIELTGTIDDLVAELDALVADLDALVTDLDVGGIVALQQAEPSFQAFALDVPLDLEAALADLQDVLASLPTGEALDGLSTLGLGAVLGAVDLKSTFTAASGTGSPAAPDAPDSPNAPGAPPGSPDVPASSLPNTGMDLYTLVMAALAALAAGGVTLALGRTSASGLVRARSATGLRPYQ